MIHQRKKILTRNQSLTKVKERKQIKFLLKCVIWLENLLKICRRNRHVNQNLLEKILLVLHTRGYKECIKYTKNLRLEFQKFIFNISPEFKLVADRPIPRTLRPIAKAILDAKEYRIIRYFFSTLYITRAFRLEPEVDTSTITDGPQHCSATPPEIVKAIPKFLKAIGMNTFHLGKVPSKLHFKEFHMSSKSGPNGHAVWTSFVDSMSIDDEMLKHLGNVGGSKLCENVTKFRTLYSYIPNFFDRFASRKRANQLRRISAIRDKEGKTRCVAILDYYSQCALRPLHNRIYRVLRSIPSDCTHDQSKKILNIQPDQGSSFHSVDLSAATDRFPILIQEEILRVLFGTTYARSWRYLMVNRPFRYGGKDLFYRTGNPMGAYSSFAMFALAHHFFIFVASLRAGRKWKSVPYMLLGDDIVIASDSVAEEYKRLLHEWNVPFNSGKTHTTPFGYEFAKRTVLHDEDVSPFPISALSDRSRQLNNSIIVIYQEVIGKLWHIDVAEAINLFLIHVRGWPYKRLSSKQRLRISFIVSTVSFLQGRGSIGTCLSQYVESMQKDGSERLKPSHYRTLSNYLLERTLNKVFQEARERITSKADKRPLGELATLLVMYVTGLPEELVPDPFYFIEAVPFLQLYGKAEERWIELQKKKYKAFGRSNSFFPDKFKKSFEAVDIPLADTGFYLRNRDVITRQSIKIVETTDEFIRENPKILNPPEGFRNESHLYGWWAFLDSENGESM